MRTSLIRAAVVAVGSVACAVTVAGPVTAVTTVTPPDQVLAKAGSVIVVQAETPEGTDCQTAWSTRIGGKRTVVASLSPVSCSGSTATWRIKVGAVKKGAASVTFTVTTAPVTTTFDDGSTETQDGYSDSNDLTITMKEKQPAPASKPAGACQEAIPGIHATCILDAS